MQGSTTGEDMDTASSSSADASTEIRPEADGASCDDSDACESAVCSPLGSCAPACPCGDTAACVALACIEVGGDGEGATGPINDSPVGTMSPDGVDVYGVVLPGPGSYRVIVRYGYGSAATRRSLYPRAEPLMI